MGAPSTRRSAPARALDTIRRFGGWLVITLAVAVGAQSLSEFHHPAFGFTRLLQISPSWGQRGLPELRETPTYIYREEAGYDGQFYAQLALRPTLQDPALRDAIDIPSMRARRILTSWIAAVVGWGDGQRTLAAYAWLNVGCWIALGCVLLRLFPPHSFANLIAWVGLMFSAGVTTSVVYALTDLPALLGLALGMLALQRGGFKTAAGAFAAACLTRETSVLSGLVFCQSHRWRQRLLCAAIMVLPMGLWFLYTAQIFESNSDSLQNFAWPLTALLGKLRTTFGTLASRPTDPMAWAAVGALISVCVQAGWLLARPQPKHAWWQFGIGYAVLLLVLGAPTLEGFPGAVTRILLPLHLAFNVLAPRTRAGLVLLGLGNLSIFIGGYMLAQGPRDTLELNHARQPSGPVIVHVGDGWNGVERNGTHTWSWCGGEGRLLVKRFGDHPANAPVSFRFLLVGELGCNVTITQNGRTLWSGFAAQSGITVTLADIELDASGHAWLNFSTAGPVRVEAGTGRRLAFAVYNVDFFNPL